MFVCFGASAFSTSPKSPEQIFCTSLAVLLLWAKSVGGINWHHWVTSEELVLVLPLSSLWGFKELGEAFLRFGCFTFKF